ncbi:MAG: bifunctional phosphoglucose/phosphomannose isomerase, partial [Rubricoccaceae bacterium]|nr:bifunctional phosphoglucose/phosphomannose isomerase [Rubricoccaceae bacterium]
LVICGMGGSAIGGDLVRTLVEPESQIPILINRSYLLPAWVDDRTLVVVSSYSGGTEETLSAFSEARSRNATIVCITSGGVVLDLAKTERLPHIVIPGGLQPRAALGYSFGPLLRFAAEIGLIDLNPSMVSAAAEHARRRAYHYSDSGGNRAIRLADELRDFIPVVYSGEGLLEAVNLRWRTQIHENAKSLAYGNLFPELDHNEIMSLEAAPTDLTKRIAVLSLRDADDHPQVERRMDITRDILMPALGKWIDIESEGESRLSRMLSLIQLGDWVSFWLAMHLQVDPSPVESIQRLKKLLAS